MWKGKIEPTYVREWQEDGSKANIVLIHGVGEHSERYQETAERLLELGYNVFTGDLTGHGLSEGARIYIESIEDYLKDVDFLISRVRNDKPLFLLGHSMGGLIVLYYMLFRKNERVRGVIASSPYIKDKIKISAVKYALGKSASVLFPKLRIESGLTGEMVCRDSLIAEVYDKDPLNCSKVTARWFVELEKARQRLILAERSFDSPCLLLQAGEDVVVDIEGIRAFYESISSEDKELVIYEQFYHEILNDPDRSEVIEKIHRWIQDRI